MIEELGELGEMEEEVAALRELLSAQSGAITAIGEAVASQNVSLQEMPGVEKRAALFAAVAVRSLVEAMLSSGLLLDETVASAHLQLCEFAERLKGGLPPDARGLCDIAFPISD